MSRARKELAEESALLADGPREAREDDTITDNEQKTDFLIPQNVIIILELLNKRLGEEKRINQIGSFGKLLFMIFFEADRLLSNFTV